MMLEQIQAEAVQPQHVRPRGVMVESRRRRTGRRSMIEEETQEIVDLSCTSLISLPNSSLNLAVICKLDLSNNNLQIIPESATARLLNLVVLDVHSNQLKSLPNSIGCLSKLKTLNVSGNLLESLPRTIENCRSLEELNANFNKLSSLPETIGFELVNLKKLSVNSNKLAFLPHSLSHLTNLRVLDARLNCLRALPEDLENLVNLEVLNVSQNFQYLKSLPYSIGLLMSLVELDVSYNRITTLPDSIGCLRKIQKLSAEGNPLVSPPIEVVEQSLNAVKEYLSEKMNAGHKSPPKKKWWARKLVKYGTFNGSSNRRSKQAGALTSPRECEREENKDGFIMTNYQNIDTLASPRYRTRTSSPRSLSSFSPFRLLSPRSSSSSSPRRSFS